MCYGAPSCHFHGGRCLAKGEGFNEGLGTAWHTRIFPRHVTACTIHGIFDLKYTMSGCMVYLGSFSSIFLVFPRVGFCLVLD